MAQRTGRVPVTGDRITVQVDDSDRVVRNGSVHPALRVAREGGRVAADRRMDRMVLVLQPAEAQQRELEALIEAQHDPSSPDYQRWLSPEEFGTRFGVSERDLETVKVWLQAKGFEIEEVPAGRRSIVFHGTVSQVERAFHTEIRRFTLNGEEYQANTSDVEIPAALAEVVHGVAALHNFQSRPMHITRGNVDAEPMFTSGSSHYLSPGDMATIYDVNALYNAGIDGTGQSVAIAGRSNINVSDVASFRTKMGLPANNPTVILNGRDPGLLGGGELTEALLDVEWAGALAKKATVKFVVSASTYTADGVGLSVQYIVNNKVAPVISVSFGACEAAMGSSGSAFYSNLWQQAAAQGQTAFISSGDSGAAGCDGASAATGTHGRGVNALCSSPYSVCVGGTQFNEGSAPATYWSSSNSSTYSSALSYIPETSWNESGSVAGGSRLWSTGGGASILYSKPSWQAGPGVPADGKRDVPDVSLSGAGHDAYLIIQSGSLGAVAGTSAASPALASIMALVVQKYNAWQGNANTVFYPLAQLQAAGGAAVFHDVTTGNNTVPGVTGYSATTGYDLATGLGSVSAYQLVNHWMDASVAPNFSVTAPGTASVTANSNSTVTVSLAVQNGLNAAVALKVTGLPAGVTAAFTPSTVPAPGSGTSSLKFTAASTATVGTYTVTVSGTSGSLTRSAAIVLSVLPTPSVNLALSATSGSITQGQTGSVVATTTIVGAFNSAITLSATGLPTGMTASFAPTSITAPGAGSATVTLSVGSAVAAKSYTIAFVATGGGLTKSVNYALTVNPPPNFTLSVPATLALTRGKTTSGTVTTTVVGGFNSLIGFGISGLPSGVTAAFAPATLAAPGAGKSTLTLTAASNAAVGKATVSVTASGGGKTQTGTFALTVSVPPNVKLTAPTTATAKQGGAGTAALSVAVEGGFSSVVTLTATGMPTGVTTVFSSSSLKAPGSGSSTLTFNAGTAAVVGTYPITLKATGSGITSTSTVNLTVAMAPYSASLTTANVNVKRNAATPATVDLTLTPTDGSLLAPVVTVAGVPSNVTVKTSTASGSGGSVKVTLAISANGYARAGSYTINVTVVSGGVTRTLPVIVNVQ